MKHWDPAPSSYLNKDRKPKLAIARTFICGGNFFVLAHFPFNSWIQHGSSPLSGRLDAEVSWQCDVHMYQKKLSMYGSSPQDKRLLSKFILMQELVERL